MSRRTKTVTRLDEISEDMARVAARMPDILFNALARVVEGTIMAESLEEVPVRTGQLRRSGAVNEPRKQGRKIVIEFGYGTDYAVYVHENLNNRHKPPTKAKYLEDPVKRNIRRIPELTHREIVMTMMEGS